MNANTEEFLSVKQAISFLGISKSTLYKLTSSKQINFYKPKGKIFFKKNDLINYITQGSSLKNEDSSNQLNNNQNGN